MATVEEPDWEAPAPAGWWRVVHYPFVWSHTRPFCDRDYLYAHGPPFCAVSHLANTVLAAAERKTDPGKGNDWLRLRDAAPFEEQWIRTEVFDCGGGVLLEPLASPPPTWAREGHRSAYRARAGKLRAARDAVRKVACATVKPSSGNPDPEPQPPLRGCKSEDCVGQPTSEYRSAIAARLLSRQGRSPGETVLTQLIRDGYTVISDVLPGSTEAFVCEMARLDDGWTLHKAKQRTREERSDRMLWLDEDLAQERYGIPAVARAILLLKGLADALNPALSQHHRREAMAGNPAHVGLPVPPASEDAVLTASARAMVACYPGMGARYMPHTDNRFRPHLGTRVNYRELTAIIYANPPDWDAERDGGALRLFPHSEDLEECPKWTEGPPAAWSSGTEPVIVNPVGGRLVVFFSALWHEVLPAYRPRRALTLWILRPDSVEDAPSQTGAAAEAEALLSAAF